MVVISRTVPKLHLLALISVCFLLVLSSNAHAHVLDYGAIETTLEVKGDLIYLQTEVPQSVRYSSYYSSSTPGELYTRAFETDFIIEKDEVPCSFSLIDFDADDPDRSYFSGVYSCEEPILSIEELRMRNSIFKESFVQYDHYVHVQLNDRQWELVFTPSATRFPDHVQAAPTDDPYSRSFAVAKRFTLLGVEHIWAGYDHLLFLLSLLILVRSVRRIILLVTTFTIAHSITLALAGLRIVSMPVVIVEPAIALTILYVAFQNFMALQKDGVNGEHRTRWYLVFLFGLVHGVGFAQVLTETSIPDDLFTSSLLFFNAGVEIGQLLVLAVLVPILYKIDTFSNRRRILLGLTILTGGVALFWFIERVVALM